MWFKWKRELFIRQEYVIRDIVEFYFDIIKLKMHAEIIINFAFLFSKVLMKFIE